MKSLRTYRSPDLYGQETVIEKEKLFLSVVKKLDIWYKGQETIKVFRP